jgi:hypothetical protein
MKRAVCKTVGRGSELLIIEVVVDVGPFVLHSYSPYRSSGSGF